MRKEGYQVETADCGLAALEAVARERPDLILLDVMLPDISGHEVARRLRGEPATAGIPIIMLSARASASDRAEGRQAGAEDYVTKPFDPKDLARRVAAAIERGARRRRDPRDQSADLLSEIAHGALVVLNVDLVWLFVADRAQHSLRSAAIASVTGEQTARQLISSVKGGPGEVAFPLAPRISPLCEAVLTGESWIDRPLPTLASLPGGELLARGLAGIRVRAASVLPLTLRGERLGAMLLARRGETRAGPRDPHLISLVASQAATGLENMRLLAELERREEDARQASQFHQTLVNTMGDGLVMLDRRDRIQFVNRRMLRMLGYSEEQLLGRDFVTLMYPADQASMRAVLRNSDSGTASFEKRILRADGSPLPVLSVLVPASTQQESIGNVLVLTDLSEQKLRESALERRNRQLAAVNRASQGMAASLDLNAVPGIILRESVEVLGAHGGSILLADEASGDLVFRAASGPEAERVTGLRVPAGQGIVGWVTTHGKSTLVTDAHTDPRFYNGIDRQTGLITVSIVAAPLLINRRAIGVVELINKIEGAFDEEDLTLLETLAQAAAIAVDNARLYRDLHQHTRQLEQAYASLQAADRVKDQMIQNVSHELRTPLTIILGYLELLAEGNMGPLTDQQRQSVEIVRRKGYSLARIVRDIVTLEQMGNVALQRQPTHLLALAEEAVRGAAPASGQAGLTLRIEHDGPLPEVPVDRLRVGQVLDNLLDNAIKFSPSGGEILVRLADIGPALEVSVVDHGIGISPESMGRLFERFYQVDGSATRRFGGVGLGLAICKEIVAAHGGEIRVESEKGRGSSFVFTLPKDEK